MTVDVVASLRRWRLRRLSPDQLLFRKYKLDKSERLEMLGKDVILSQLAAPIASAIYYLVTQFTYSAYATKDHSLGAVGSLTDTWDRLPVHVANLLGYATGQVAPAWWVTARHDFRHVLLGFLVIVMVGAVTIGLKPRKRASTLHMIASVPLALLAAIAVATPLIMVSGKISQWGLSSSNAWVSTYLGKGSVLLVIIGIIAAFPARKILARTMDTIQLMSLEKKISEQETPKWWWKVLYTPNYRNRFAYLTESGHQPEPHGKTMGVVLTLGTPVFLALLAFGTWLLYFGPAAGA